MKSITAYIRLANEENTIIPCLESIKDIFDEILILHSDITDNSLELIYNYKTNQKINIQQYPYSVIPPHSDEYKTRNYDSNRSLAAYYNYGLKFIKTDLLLKIDADQIYFHDEMIDLIHNLKNNTEEKIAIGIQGHNCIINNNHIYEHKPQPYNGGPDHFCINTKDAHFQQTIYWELLRLPYKIEFDIIDKKYWIHIKKGHRFNNKFVSGNTYPQESLGCFNEELIQKYEKYVLPLLIKTQSPLQTLKYKC